MNKHLYVAQEVMLIIQMQLCEPTLCCHIILERRRFHSLYSLRWNQLWSESEDLQGRLANALNDL